MSIQQVWWPRRIRTFGLVGGPVQVGMGCAERVEGQAGVMLFNLLLLGMAARDAREPGRAKALAPRLWGGLLSGRWWACPGPSVA